MAATAKLGIVRPSTLQPELRTPEPRCLLTAEDVSRITGLSVETLAQWRSQRRGIPFLKLSRNVVRYRQADLDRWLAERIVRVDELSPVRGGN